MAKLISVLHLEDNVQDAELVSSLLAQEGLNCKIQRVASRDEFKNALKEGTVDVILADYALPAFDGRSALAVAQEVHPQTPFIFVSGTIGEEVAIDSIKSGATDYVLKQRLSRLVPSVKRALLETQERHDRKKLERLIRQSEKMATVGQLAAGVAHELNNPLAVILGFAQSELQHQPGRESMVTIEREAQRCRRLVQDLLMFSRDRQPHRQPEDPVSVISHTLSLIETQARVRGLQVVRQWPAELPRTTMDRTQIEQVVINFCSNAMDATASGGTLTVRMNVVEKDSTAWLKIEVADTGTGITPTIRDRLFEPFFTTKESGKGTGLGLPLCLEIVKKHKGKIEFESEPGCGASFWILLPLSPE